MKISKDRIAEAAIAILNREGADGLTMRALAAELGTQPATLYNHIQNKDELYTIIADTMSESYEVPLVFSGAKDYLIASAKATREMLLTVRDSTVIFENSMPNTPVRLKLISGLFAAYRAMGIPDSLLMLFSNMSNNYVTSYVADECRAKKLMPEDVADFVKEMGIASPPVTLSKEYFDAAFETGLNLLFAGLDAIMKKADHS